MAGYVHYEDDFGPGLILKLGNVCDRCYKEDPEKNRKRSKYITCELCGTVKYCSKECHDLDRSSHLQLFCRMVGDTTFKQLLEHRFLLLILAYMAWEKTPSKHKKLPLIRVIGPKHPSEDVKFEIHILHQHTDELECKLKLLNCLTSWQDYCEDKIKPYALVEILVGTQFYGVELQLENVISAFQDFNMPKDRKTLLRAINYINEEPGVRILSKNLQKLFRK